MSEFLCPNSKSMLATLSTMRLMMTKLLYLTIFIIFDSNLK